MKHKYNDMSGAEHVTADLEAVNRGVSGQCLFEKDLDYDPSTGKAMETENINMVYDTYAKDMMKREYYG